VVLQVTAMFSRLKLTFETRIRSLSWLDEATRQEALYKLASLRGHFLTWPQLWNETYVASLLHDVSCHALCMWRYACFSFVPYFIFGESDRTLKYVGLPSTWGSVDGYCMFSPHFVGGLLFGVSDRYKLMNKETDSKV